MLKRLRRRSADIAAALVALLAIAGAPHSTDPDHDADHRVVIVAHDESAHRERMQSAPAGTDERPLHCLVCHLARSFRPRTEARSSPVPATRAGARVHIEVRSASSAAPAAQPPLRSPPPSPLPM